MLNPNNGYFPGPPASVPPGAMLYSNQYGQNQPSPDRYRPNYPAAALDNHRPNASPATPPRRNQQEPEIPMQSMAIRYDQPPPQAHYQQAVPATNQYYGGQHSPVHGPGYEKPVNVSQSGGLQRKKTLMNIPLTNGHLVIDSPVPDRVLENAAYRTGEEFTHMRYTAATCDPNDFAPQNYTLRPAIYGRQTELFIVMTMYNENDELFCKTMSSVMKNISHLCTRSKSKTWGDNGWQKVTVCIVADGRKKCHPRVLTCLAAMGVYQEGVAKNTVNDRDVTAHIYEYTTQVMIGQDLQIRGADAGSVPVQIIFCLKEQNKKKLNSHRWFFNAFGPIINPNVCILLDVGTKPTSTSIYHLWKAFDRDPAVGGACGEIAAELGKGWANLLNPLVATQNFEYKMSNILDKPLESVFGYISVLPGAFSAYRYKALQDSAPGVGPLSQYFKGETMHGAGAGVFEANMYLAEDRILCFELVAKPHCGWLLKYVKSAKAETDVPDNVPEFISQRRRWLNGSFFAAAYSLWKWSQIWSTDHSFFRKILFQVEFVYNTISILFNWFALGNFYLTFFFLTNSATNPNIEGPFSGNPALAAYGFAVIRQIYLFSIIVTFICALGNRPQGSKFIYTLVIILFSIVMVVMLYMAGYTVVSQVAKVMGLLRDKGVTTTSSTLRELPSLLAQNAAFRDIVISLASTYGMYFIASFLHFEPWHMFTCFLQYMFMLPAFVNILMVYAFCNTHDVSWGTKGDNGTKTDLGAAVTKTNKDGVETVEMEVPHEKEDTNETYNRILRELAVRPEEKHEKRDATTKKEDYYKSFRTRLVLFWMFSNALLIIVFTLPDNMAFINFSNGVNPYLTFIFWSVAVLSLVRFVGSVLYLILRAIFG